MFINEIFIASSTYEEKVEENIPLIKPKEVIKEKWKILNLSLLL